ncbi:hypothetical protein [Antarcticirhabdus aurantiaca]|uniref:Uncharacterized protein n=1 Tax=Antarcticirhabdus aurantiaca TaxID=2606717 RepID=A0ACD4NKZ0_9HYPH|nr:hypothetical protein [Antarcticirhabdus aurantiaca]WAJ27457.1 hypothetical protein OXU80_21820 [Jeongeuplla avenae]
MTVAFRRLVLPAALVLGLAVVPALAQSPAPSASSDAAAPPVAAGKGDEPGMIAGLCGVQMKSMTPLACKCLSERAMIDLSAPQRDYLVATAVSPPVADRMLADGRVGRGDQEIIFTFLDRTSDACASGIFVAPAAPTPTPTPTPTPAAPSASPAPPAGN